MKIDGEDLERIQQEARDTIASGCELDDLVEETYNGELNFNNADPTSQQRCWGYDEIHEAVFSVLEEEEEQ